MPAERNAFKLGLSMILFVILLVAVLVFLAPTAGGDLKVHVRYPHEQLTVSLKPGGEVTCGGKPVGSIEAFTLQEMTDEETGYPHLFAVASIAISEQVGLREDCKIVPVGQLLGGPGQLVIADRGTGEPVPRETMIDGEPGAGIAELTAMLADQLDPDNPAGLLAVIQAQLDAADADSLLGKIHASLDDINRMTLSLSEEFDPDQQQALLGKLHGILNNVNRMTDLLRNQMDASVDEAALAKVHQTLDTLNSSLRTVVGILEENRIPLHETIVNIRDTSIVLEEQIAARIAEQLDPGNAAGLLAKVHLDIERLGRALEDINAITGDLRSLVALNKNEIDEMITNLKETSDHLKAGSKEIRLNPWLLLYTPSEQETAEAQLFGTARTFSEAATQLDDAISRLQSLTRAERLDSPEQQEQLQVIREQLRTTFEKFRQAEEKLWERLNIQ